MRRTAQQNKALHKYFELLAEALNDAGYEMKEVLAVKEVDIPWTKDTVKSVLWKPIQDAMFHVEHTSDLEKILVDDVYRVLDRHISINFGVHVPWPSEESLLDEKRH